MNEMRLSAARCAIAEPCSAIHLFWEAKRALIDIRSGITPGRRGLRRDALGQHAHDVGLLHDQEFLAIELDFGARPFAEQHPVAHLEVDRDELAGLVAPARTDRRNLTLRWLLLRGIGNDDAALGLFLG